MVGARTLGVELRGEADWWSHSIYADRVLGAEGLSVLVGGTVYGELTVAAERWAPLAEHNLFLVEVEP